MAVAEQRDFEQAWLAKFTSCLDAIAGEEIRKQVIKGCEGLSSDSSRRDVIAWTKVTMQRLESLLDEEQRKEIIVGCACQYPKPALQQARRKYEETEDVALVHQMLQAQFESFLSDSLKLNDGLVEEIVERGWGLAGVLQGNTIIATKIPKSGFIVDYMQEPDPGIRRQYYCHCPRIRDVLKSSEAISATYCYCGAGYYKGIWEEILQKSVEVEVLETVLKGDDVCRVAIRLPVSQ